MGPRLILKNFRGIREGRIELAPLTILLGPNNSGKTTILEALFLLPNPFRRLPYNGQVAIQVLHNIHKTLESSGYAFLLYNYTSKKATIRYEADSGHAMIELLKLPERGRIALTTDKELSTKILVEGAEHYHLGDVYDPLNGYEVKNQTLVSDESLLFSPELMRGAQKYISNEWITTVNLGLSRTVAKEASALSRDSYIDLTNELFLGGGFALNAYYSDGRRIRLGDLGAGIQNYIIWRLLYELVKPKIILWDDIEAHFNPRILQRLALWLADLIDEERQLIISTHSLEAAKILASQDEARSRIYLVDLEDGNLRSKAFSLDDVEQMSSAGVDVRVAERLLL